ncbi:MAG: carbohydrate kinase family protein [Alphaproteobacteria bacterium]|nr:carbohydrate kinase family protein [Alphaproteobacteria bacterium]
MTKPINILTFGSCGWDRILTQHADGSRTLIYEEEGRKNSHQAVAAKRAGATQSTLVSFVGDDEIGTRVLQSLKDCGVDTSYIQTVPGAATEINNQIFDEATKDYSLERGPAELSSRYSPFTVDEYTRQILNSNFVILVSKQPKNFLTAAIDFCHENKIPTVMTMSHEKFDIKNPHDYATLKKCTFLAGNFEEAQITTGKTDSAEMLKLLPNFLITKGADGVYFKDEKNNIQHEPAVPVEKVVETNGAGDTFIGNFIVFHAGGGKSIKECVRHAQCASAIEVGKMGVLDAMPFRTETEELYRRHYGNQTEANQTQIESSARFRGR